MATPRRSRRDTPIQVASGIEELISRLRDEGVAQGRQESDELLSQAKARAHDLVSQAESQAKEIVEKARSEAEKLEQSSQQALQLAFRDTTLKLKAQLSQRFAGEVKRLVGEEQEKKEILEKMILEVAGRVRADVDRSEKVTMILPEQVVGVADLSQNPEELEKGVLSRFVQLNAESLLREGITFGVATDRQRGLKVRLEDRDIVLDLSDEAIAEAILEHLQPRFRALLEGVVR